MVDDGVARDADQMLRDFDEFLRLRNLPPEKTTVPPVKSPVSGALSEPTANATPLTVTAACITDDCSKVLRFPFDITKALVGSSIKFRCPSCKTINVWTISHTAL